MLRMHRVYEAAGKAGRRCLSVLLAGTLAGGTLFCLPVSASAKSSGWETVGAAQSDAAGSEESASSAEEDATAAAVAAVDVGDETPDEDALDEETGLAREKEYLLEALDQLEDMGLSPIKIWSQITQDQRVMDQVDSVRDAVTGRVTETVDAAGDAAAEAVNEAVEKETEKVKKSLMQMIQDSIQNFLEGIFSGTTQSGEDSTQAQTLS